jgi:spore germination protein GerM
MSLKDFFVSIGSFFKAKGRRRFLFLVLIGLFAWWDFRFLGLVRRTFVFYSVADWSIIVEDRMLRRAESREDDMIRYVEEFLLGPVSPDLAPLFPRETRLESLLYRDGVAYVDLSESALFPTPEQSAGGSGDSAGVFGNFQTLYRGIRRNFPYVREVRLFVNGNIAFAGEFGIPETAGILE